jgi:hypothetical protein
MKGIVAITLLASGSWIADPRELSVPAGMWKVIRKTEFDVRSSVAPRPMVAD